MAKDETKTTTTTATLPPVEPRTTAPTAITLSFEQLQQLMSLSAKGQADAASLHAIAMKQVMDPENRRHPDVSAFNPKGERDHPRPAITYTDPHTGESYAVEAFYGQFPIQKDDLKVEEIELLNAVQPGSYQITKGDGSKAIFEIIARRDGHGKVDRLTIYPHAATLETKDNWPSFENILWQLVDQKPKPHQPSARPQLQRSPVEVGVMMDDVVPSIPVNEIVVG